MMVSPAGWANAFEDTNHKTEVKAVVGGVTYTENEIAECRIQSAAFENFSIGNACSATLTLKLLTEQTIPKAAEIHIFCRLISGETQTDWVQQGVFSIDQRAQEDGWVSITAFDAMLSAEQDYFGSTISGSWPKTMASVANEIAARMGITVDSRTTYINNLSISAPVGMTCRDVLRYIAAANGGNWIVTKSNHLYLLPIASPEEMIYLVDESGNDYIADEAGNRVILIQGDNVSCGGNQALSNTITVSKVTLYPDDSTEFSAGNAGYELYADCPYATQDAVNALANSITGKTYNAFQASSVVLNPLNELGDSVGVDDKMSRLYSMDMDIGGGYIGDVSAPIEGDTEHEYPYQDKSIGSVKREIAKTKAEILTTIDSISLSVESVQGSVSQLSLSVDSINLSVQDANNNIASISASLNSITMGVQNGQESSTITLYKDNIAIASQTVQFTGEIVFKSNLTDGSTYISGGTLTTCNIYACNLYAQQGNAYDYSAMGSYGMAVYLNNDQKALIGINPNTSYPALILGSDTPGYVTKYWENAHKLWIGNGTMDCGIKFNFTEGTYHIYGTPA